MEFLNAVNNPAVQQWSVLFVVVLFLVGGVVLLAIGLSLIYCTEGALRFVSSMNRRVSMRGALKPAEIPRDTRQAAQKYRRWLAVIFIAGGIVSILGLAAGFDTRGSIFLFNLNSLHATLASWLVESARWLLIVGNVVAIVVGILLAVFPDALAAIEARGARWYSERQLMKDVDKPNLALDARVAAFPRASGWIITFFALVLIGAFGFALSRI